MKRPRQSRILPSHITPPQVYLQRRELLAGLAAAMVAPPLHAAPTGATLRYRRDDRYSTDETPNSWEEITTYNNFYEFGTGKQDPSEQSGRFRPSPWSVKISGEAEVTGTYTLEDILRPHPLEERIYRLRCVEAWSMVIPWVGFPLADLLRRFKPTSKAKYVAFTTVLRPSEMPGQRFPVLSWPYVE